MIPVVIGAIILGPGAGAVLGAVFGLTSFVQCFGLDTFGTTLMGIQPVYTFIMCMFPRILMGTLCGVIFKGLVRVDKTRHKVIAYPVTGSVRRAPQYGFLCRSSDAVLRRKRLHHGNERRFGLVRLCCSFCRSERGD